MLESWIEVKVPQEEIPAFAKPEDEAGRAELEQFRTELAAMHRHEDTLLNHRLQGFLVATSLLVAAYSQFRDPQFALVAVALCCAGLALAAVTEHILRRTARAIEWYIRTIRSIEEALYSDDLRPYSTRRQRTPRHRLHISAILGVGFPLGAIALWMLLLAWAVWNWTRR